MTGLRIRTPSRLHFGLLGWGSRATRQFGGVGLMVEDPGIEIRLEPGPEWGFSGPLSARVRDLVSGMLDGEGRPGLPGLGPARIEVVSAAPEHSGLGVGTQLSLAVVHGLLLLAGEPPPPPELLAGLTGRGRRSGVGLHGFGRGGLIVDAGRSDESGPPCLVAQSPFPEDWAILLVSPPGPRGRHGSEESRSFAELTPPPDRVTERLCRLILLGILPALAERDLPAFGAAVSLNSSGTSRGVRAAPGGALRQPLAEAIVAELGRIGLVGAGQSSWGPTLYAFSRAEDSERERIRARIAESFGLDRSSLRWTRAANRGAIVERLDA
ncbi:MAG: beta-ribofuranosylaminobenzene 5'-phosphate synthase family protein [Isosphaeraceae bacterium]